ncbi:MAG: serine/threonine-protein kinase [Myxococcota bacterium]
MNASTRKRVRTRERTAAYRPLGAEGRLARAGRYELRERLGLGGMGAVYEAWDPELARRVAVKLMRPRSDRDATEAQARLRREAQSMAALQHPNVLGVYDVGLTPSGVFLAMPLVDGPDVATWLRERPHWRKIIEVFVAAGRGLAAAHAAGIVHRDFKPTNVLVDRAGGVFVCDFGVAAFVQGDQRFLTPVQMGADTMPKPARLTRKGSAMGTPAYMAPEQHEGRLVDARSDQFSFCVALFEALYGHLPFEGLTTRALWQAKKGRLPSPPPGSGVPRRLHSVLERGLSWSPEERYPSMDELLVDLRRITRNRAWQRLVAGTALSGLAVLGLTAAAFTDQTSEPEPEHATCTSAQPKPTKGCDVVADAIRSFGRARRLARDPLARPDGIALARATRVALADSQCPSAVELHAEITGWLDAVDDIQNLAPIH